MDSPGIYPDSPSEQDDVVYPCKGCGDILEEGKAFELAGNRWHIDCFRCNTCGTLLDSDANLLLLGDGSLICNNCTYSCNACGNKIEDLAILTGDQAFCASCFCCRNCKRKIENLRYARTSQGIFCMSCHESLMARRRKKSKTPKPVQPPAVNGGPVEKALPSLPPGATLPTPTLPPARELPPAEVSSDPLGSRSPRDRERDRNMRSRKDASPNGLQRTVPPTADDARRGLTLPASTYGDSRPSNVSEETEDGEERGFLPMTFDPTPILAGPPPTSAPVISRKELPRQQASSPSASNENKLPRDYFGRPPAKPPTRDALRPDDQRPSSSRSPSAEADLERTASQSKTSPHILSQAKSNHRRRDTSENIPVPGPGASLASPPAVGTGSHDAKLEERPKPQPADAASFALAQPDGFKLQEVPKERKAGSRSRGNSSAAVKSPAMLTMFPIPASTKHEEPDRGMGSHAAADSITFNINPFDDPKRKENPAAPGAAAPSPRYIDRPARLESLPSASLKANQSSPEPPTPTTLLTQLAAGHGRKDSTASVPASFADAKSTISRNNSSAKPDTEPPRVRSSFDSPPPRASTRPSAPSKSVANGDFIAPRAPPQPPPPERHRYHESISTLQSVDARSDGPPSPAIRSAGLPMHSADGPFSMEEEMARILHGESRKDSQANDGSPASVLRRVSNAVKHGRSFSDRGLNSAPIEISSPLPTSSTPSASSPPSQAALDQLRAQLRRANQRIAELEAEKSGLQNKVDNSAEITAASDELREKRNTMVVLDTQREMVVAELESMTAHLKKAKDSNQPLDLNALKTDILRDFADSLQKVKQSMKTEIEDLMHRRNQLTDEIGTLIQMKDKGFQEYESLSAKNVQLREMNNQLVHSIQETYKANATRPPNGVTGVAPAANGLGIYQSGAKPDPSDLRHLNTASTETSLPDSFRGDDAEPATILTAPQMVNIRKGQPKKFNWRKGGEKMAKNVTKGIKGAFGDRPPQRDGQSPYGEIGIPYSQTQAAGGSEQGSVSSKQGVDAGKAGGVGAGFGFFGQKPGGLRAGQLGSLKNGSSTNVAAGADGSVLFGSELEARCEFEKRVVPSIVSRCVEEVESRGMDVEGVYRKSGGSGQVKTVQQGFEKDNTYDISDPDLDIHAVTSTLKQYFRKLPTPLITYNVYDGFLDAGQTTDKEKQGHSLRMAVAGLPEHHRDCLEYLVQHLARVMSHESANLMTPLNLAVVFAPTIMRPLSIEREMSDMQAQLVAVQALLEQHETVFETEE